jgi:hypothetical protein
VHFLAHFHLECSGATNEFLFGNSMPDLVASFTKLFHQKLNRSEVSLVYSELEIINGIRTHFEDDKLFHAQSDFEKLCRQLTNTMLQKQLDRNSLRLSFLAHLLVEILFDRWLSEQHPTLPKRFYEMLENVKMASVETYCFKHDLADVFAIVAEKRTRFLQHRFLFQLAESEQVAKGVCNLYARTTGRTITNSELFRIIDSINEFYALSINWKVLLVK